MWNPCINAIVLVSPQSTVTFPTWFHWSFPGNLLHLRNEEHFVVTASVLQTSHLPFRSYFIYWWISHFSTQLLIIHKELPVIALLWKWKKLFKIWPSFVCVSFSQCSYTSDIKAHYAILKDCIMHGYAQRKSTSVWKMNAIYTRNNLSISINLASEGLQSKNEILFYLLIYCL